MLGLTVKIVSAHVSSNPVPPDALPALIQQVYRTLSNIGDAPVERAPRAPVVPILKSVFPDRILCLEDGKQQKLLKRHLMSAHGMTPRQHREKWGLPPEYPMVAPNYAKRRSALAKKLGLGIRARDTGRI